ncbi:MAG: BREX system P-loop protein BrxC [Verrucomicrobiales bacterium]|nr:BREX system P-loop protein BrxC [Verrucomicrobiales bacterium]
MSIRSLFDTTRQLDRRIEKVVTYDSKADAQLVREISEYVITENIEANFERLLSRMQDGFQGAEGEVGVWVSGFYGSGKSSFTKYLGFALDPAFEVDGRPFIEFLQDRIKSAALKAQLKTVATKHPAQVFMIDLGRSDIAGPSLANLSNVLYWTVMQWAGYSRDRKIAYLQFKLERDGKWEAFNNRVKELKDGRSWKEIMSDLISSGRTASILAPEFYPEDFPDEKAFSNLKIDEAILEDDRAKEMLELIRRKSGKENVIFILDEVGQYVASTGERIRNLQGFAENMKNIGGGKAWIISTAQQRLTEDDPTAALNAVSLFKLKDRFPIPVDLEATDIREICYERLLTKSGDANTKLEKLFDANGVALQHHTKLKGTRLFSSDLDKESFRKLYPFLPQHFNILLEMLSSLAKSKRGDFSLRSAIKVIQDVLVDPNNERPDTQLLANAEVGTLATVDIFYDTLRHDIERSDFKHVTVAVRKAEEAFGTNSFEGKIARAVAALQILNEFPTDEENLAALIHPSAEADSQIEKVKEAVKTLQSEPAVPLNRDGEGKLRFMSEAIQEVDAARNALRIPGVELSRELSDRIRNIFSPLPNVRLAGTRKIQTGIKLIGSRGPQAVEGEREAIQTIIEFVDAGSYDRRRDELLTESGQPTNRHNIFWLARSNSAVERLLNEIKKCEAIHGQYRSRAVEKEVSQYLDSQLTLASTLRDELDDVLRKALSEGSFVFKSDPAAVSGLDSEVTKAIDKQLDSVAEKVFAKYPLAPVQADTKLAVQFLKAATLDRAAEQYDPVKVIKTEGGSKSIDTEHPALVAICDYLSEHGRRDGNSLMNDLYDPEFGWSKDTTRYLLAALFKAGKVQLRIGGDDITVVGEQALAAFQNSNSFRNVGVSLRDQPPDPDAIFRAVKRILKLSGESVDPLEDEISNGVLKNFPPFMDDFASLAVELGSADLPGADRAESLMEGLRQIIAADASSATPVLGAETCDLYDDIVWAKNLRKTFKEGLLTTVKELRHHLQEINSLPDAGAAGKLGSDTEDLRSELSDKLAGDDFFEHQATLQSGLSSLKSSVEDCCGELAAELTGQLERGAETIQAMPEWTGLNQEHRESLSARLESLKPSGQQGMVGLRTLLNQPYAISSGLDQIRTEVLRLAKEKEDVPPKEEEKDDEKEDLTEETVTLPAEIASESELDSLIDALRQLSGKLKQFKRIKLTWKTGDSDD